MNFRTLLLTISFVAGSNGIVLAETPANYVGVGIRAGLNDDPSGVIDSKVKLANLGDLSFSARPALLFGSTVELRAPITIEGKLVQGLSPYAGAGISYNKDGNSSINPIITGGLDINIAQNLVADLKLNVIWTSDNTDAEFIGALNYTF